MCFRSNKGLREPGGFNLTSFFLSNFNLMMEQELIENHLAFSQWLNETETLLGQVLDVSEWF